MEYRDNDGKIKLFVVSDVHGHAALLSDALKNAGFDPNNSNHILIGGGDYFDRGNENRDVLKYLSSLKNKVLIRGNHEDMLTNALRSGHIDYHHIYNGTVNTITDFFGEDSIDESGHISKNNYTVRKLYKFINDMCDYFETENYVFVHGWIPMKTAGKDIILSPDWRRSSYKKWEKSRSLKWPDMYKTGLTLPDKTIVCGHRSCEYGGLFDAAHRARPYDIFYGDNMIAIDACTVESKQVNVLVVEDRLLKPDIFEMKLDSSFFELVRRGSKTVEMCLDDKKRNKIKAGDRIIFSDASHRADKITVNVKACYKYDDFDKLSEDFKPRELGFSGKSRRFIAGYMKDMYGSDSIKCKGALAIRIAR